MKRIFIFLVLSFSIFLVGCGSGNKSVVQQSELQRFKVKVVEVDEDYYIVEKNGYTIGGIYYLTADDDNIKLGDILYVIVLDDYKCMLFSEYMNERELK